MSDNVIELKFRAPEHRSDTLTLTSCRICANKTFRVVEDKPDFFPILQCAACGNSIGRIGWYHEGPGYEVPA